jgi:formate/nitrite transporter FocA (FNT family)
MAKAALPWWELFILAFMAGMYVSVGGVFSVMIAGGVSGAGVPGSSAAGLANRAFLSQCHYFPGGLAATVC